MPTPQTIIIIDDHPLLRRGLQQLVELCPDLTIIGEADNGKDGIDLVLAKKPDITLLDLNMPEMDGIETLIRIKQKNAALKIIILTVSDAEEDVVTALRKGADGYLLKDMEPEELLIKLNDVAQGKLVLSPNIIQCLGRALRTEEKNEHSVVNDLTSREQEIICHIHKCESNKLIARNLNITEATVKVHVKHILKKLNLKTRVEVAVWVSDNKQLITNEK